MELKDIHKGEDIWILNAGSSMNFVDNSFFDNKITMSLISLLEIITVNKKVIKQKVTLYYTHFKNWSKQEMHTKLLQEIG